MTQASLLRALIATPDMLDAAVRGSVIRLAQQGGQVRVQAIEALEALDDHAAAPALWTWARASDFEACPAGERQTILRALVQLAPEDQVVPYMEGILTRRNLLRRKGIASLQLAAAQALGGARSDESIALLERRLRTRSPELKRACESALASIRTRRASEAPPPEAQEEGADPASAPEEGESVNLEPAVTLTPVPRLELIPTDDIEDEVMDLGDEILDLLPEDELPTGEGPT